MPPVGRSSGRSSASGNLDRNRGIPQRPQRISFGSKSSLWNQWKSAFLQRASEEAPTHRQPEFPRREHAHDVETQVGGAMRHFRSRFPWVWNLRLELSQRTWPSPLRTTPLAEAVTPETAATVVAGPTLPQVHALEASAPELVGQWARAARPGLFEGLDFTPQENGTLRCPAGQSLWERERRPQADGSLRISYAARRGSGRACALRAQCLRGEPTQALGRKVSVVVGRTPAPASPAAAPLCAPLAVGTQPVLWRDWERRAGRRAWMGNIHQAKKGRGKEKQRKTRFR